MLCYRIIFNWEGNGGNCQLCVAPGYSETASRIAQLERAGITALGSRTNSARRGSFIRCRFLELPLRVQSWTVTGAGGISSFIFSYSCTPQSWPAAAVFLVLEATRAPGAGKGTAVPAMSLSQASNSAGDRKKPQSCPELCRVGKRRHFYQE